MESDQSIIFTAKKDILYIKGPYYATCLVTNLSIMYIVRFVPIIEKIPRYTEV